MAAVNVKTLGYVLDGQGISFETVMSASPLLSLLYYDFQTIQVSGGKSLKPKELINTPWIADDGYTVRWRDVDKRPRTTKTDGATAGAATTIVVDDASIFTAGDTVYVPLTRETFLITSISSNTLTVNPAVGAAGFADDSEVRWVSFATGLGTSTNKAVSIMANDEQTNYMQHTAFDLTFDAESLNKT